MSAATAELGFNQLACYRWVYKARVTTTDKQNNLTALLGLIDAAAAGGAELVVIPESSIYATLDPEWVPSSVAEPLDGPFITAIRAQARMRCIRVVVGTLEQQTHGLPYNTVVSIDPMGEIDGTYRKVHLYDAFGYTESSGISAGQLEAPFVLNLRGHVIGAVTCYDLRFPESARPVIDEGADIILIPACWVAGPGKVDQWQTLIRARAIENTAYVVAANQTGPIGTGHSLIVDPAGVVLAAAEETPGLIFAETAPERVEDIRRQAPVLRNRRFTVMPRVTA